MKLGLKLEVSLMTFLCVFISMHNNSVTIFIWTQIKNIFVATHCFKSSMFLKFMQSCFIMIDLTVGQVFLTVLSDSLSSHGE